MQHQEVEVAGQKPIRVADFIAAQLAHLPAGMTQKDVANAIGYDKPNVLAMIKKGSTKLPINKVPALAKALGVDAAHLFRLTLNEYMPDVMEVVETIVGRPISINEVEVLTIWRQATQNTDPRLFNKRDVEAFTKVAEHASKIERDALTRKDDDMRRKDTIVIRKPKTDTH